MTTLAIHFTPSRYAWSKLTPIRDTGIVSKIYMSGLRQYSNVVLADNPDAISTVPDYIHHGMRTNNARGIGPLCIPAAILVDIDGLPIMQGYDGKYHRQINVPVSPKRILRHSEIDPNNLIETYITTAKNSPIGISRLGNKKYIAFREEFNNRRTEILTVVSNIINDEEVLNNLNSFKEFTRR